MGRYTTQKRHQLQADQRKRDRYRRIDNFSDRTKITGRTSPRRINIHDRLGSAKETKERKRAVNWTHFLNRLKSNR